MVLHNKSAIKSCSVLVAQLNNQEITTIEHLQNKDELHPMQNAFRNNHGLQCGFCTPGMIMSAISLVNENKNPTEKEIRKHLEGNLCRCTGYQNIALRASTDGQELIVGRPQRGTPNATRHGFRGCL